jgi:signal transduction histidine kinase
MGLDKNIQTTNFRARLSYHVSATLLGFAVIGLIALMPWDSANSWITDLLWRIGTPVNPDPEIRLIAFDDASAYRYTPISEIIPGPEISGLAKFLADAQPRNVAFLTSISSSRYTPEELTDFRIAFQKLPHVYLGYDEDALLGQRAPEPLRAYPYFPAFISRDSQSYAADAVSRRVMIEIDSIPSIFSIIANDMNPGFGADRSRYEKNGAALQTYIRWQGPPGTYPIHSSRRVLDGDVPASEFKGKTVLIGSLRHMERARDFTFTPFDRNDVAASSLEVAAHGLVTLIRDNGVQHAPGFLDLLLAFAIGTLTVNLVLLLSPASGMVFLLGLVGVIGCGAWFLLHGPGICLATGLHVFSAVFCYYLVIPFRLVYEYRRRSHYQEKSEWMAQLEELKSNFLSLISHDLKTPVATIQGNAEIALRDSALPQHLRPVIGAIVQTTEHLSQYVESVLDLTRVESAQVPLQKTTKDINSTIREVVDEKRILAAEKNIDIQLQLEPLFSFKYDVRLMKRVLANLLENAIKYCPPHSHVILATKDEGEFVSVSVIDNGPGIAPEDREKIFEKFYRGAAQKEAAIKGSGLGLYLVKYFVELHKGLVKIQSEVGKGTSFVVQLPVQGAI